MTNSNLLSGLNMANQDFSLQLFKEACSFIAPRFDAPKFINLPEFMTALNALSKNSFSLQDVKKVLIGGGYNFFSGWGYQKTLSEDEAVDFIKAIRSRQLNTLTALKEWQAKSIVANPFSEEALNYLREQFNAHTVALVASGGGDKLQKLSDAYREIEKNCRIYREIVAEIKNQGGEDE